jgi:hypothetical protein
MRGGGGGPKNVWIRNTATLLTVLIKFSAERQFGIFPTFYSYRRYEVLDFFPGLLAETVHF